LHAIYFKLYAVKLTVNEIFMIKYNFLSVYTHRYRSHTEKNKVICDT